MLFACRRVGAVAALVTFAVLAWFGGVGRAQSADALARRLATLRADVETLSEKLAAQKNDAHNQMQSLARQKSDLQIELEREQMRAQKLRATLDKKKSKMAETASAGEELGPVYTSAMAGMRRYVEGSLPFRRTERLAELDKIEDQRRTGILTYPRALTRLWSFIEDEARMTHENAAYQQTITVDGADKLADVVRIGMVAMYFQTQDGELGYTRKSGDEWSFVRARDASERKNIRYLFDSFKKQIRVGLFQLPNALPPVSK